MTVPKRNRAHAFDDFARKMGWPAKCDPELDFEAPLLCELLAVWREQSAHGDLPNRHHLGPRVLKSFLGWICILERCESGPVRYRIRLMGSHLANALGDMQGKYLEEVLTPEVVLHWQARLELAETEHRPMRFISRVDIPGKQHLRSESFWAPLAAQAGAPPQFLMAAVLSLFDGQEFEPDSSDWLVA